jgi:hypothetical protein
MSPVEGASTMQRDEEERGFFSLVQDLQRFARETFK